MNPQLMSDREKWNNALFEAAALLTGEEFRRIEDLSPWAECPEDLKEDSDFKESVLQRINEYYLQSSITPEENSSLCEKSPRINEDVEEQSESFSDQFPGAQVAPSDRYTIKQEIGRGGVGVVHMAYDNLLKCEIAIKLLRQEHLSNNQVVQRFIREAQILRELQCPGIVPIYDFGILGTRSKQGTPFFTMKLVRGDTLKEVLEDENPDITMEAKLKLFEQVCRTVAFTHTRDVVHRDLKPHNVMVEKGKADHVVLVMDWGLGKFLSEREQKCLPEDTNGASQTVQENKGMLETKNGQVMGTYPYMSPEQAKAEKIDKRSDVFGLGAILCRILTGNAPYKGHDRNEILNRAESGKIDEETRLLLEKRTDEWIPMAQLALNCLEASKEKRPENGNAVLSKIEDFYKKRSRIQKQNAEKLAVAKGRAPLRRGLVIALIALITMGVLWALWHQHNQHQRKLEQVQQQQKEESRRQKLTNHVKAALKEGEIVRKKWVEELGDKAKGWKLLSNIDEWVDMLEKEEAAFKLAQELAKSDLALIEPIIDLRITKAQEIWNEDETHKQIVLRLNKIILTGVGIEDGELRPQQTVSDFEEVFNSMNLDVRTLMPKELAMRINRSPIKLALLIAVDHWAVALSYPSVKDKSLQPKLLKIARHIDPEKWRNQFRDLATWHNRDKLQKLAKDLDLSRQPPHIVYSFGKVLKANGIKPVEIWRNTLLLYPSDFWLHFSSGTIFDDPREIAAAYQTAIGLRPKSSLARFNLGLALRKQGDLPRAILAYTEAIKLNSEIAKFWYNRGNAYFDQGDFEKAKPDYQRAVNLNPRYAKAWHSLGNLHHQQQNLELAIDAYETAIDCDKHHALSYVNLGQAYFDQGKIHKAKTEWEKADGLPSKLKGVSNAIKKCEEIIDNKNKAKALLANEKANGKELLDQADQHRLYLKQYKTALELYMKAFDKEPDLKENIRRGNRYKAVCAAVLALQEDSGDKVQIDLLTRNQLHLRAINWIRDEYRSWCSSLKSDPLIAPVVYRNLTHWTNDPDLRTIREANHLLNHSPEVRAGWKQLWCEIVQTAKVIRARYQEYAFTGKLTNQHPLARHLLKLRAKTHYKVEIQSSEFVPVIEVSEIVVRNLVEVVDPKQNSHPPSSTITFYQERERDRFLFVSSSDERIGGYSIKVYEFTKKK